MKIQRLRFISLLTITIFLVASYAWVQFREHRKPERQHNMPTVSTIRVTAQEYQPTLTAIGVLRANQGTILKAQTDGQVERITFNSGEEVKMGDCLVTLNNTQQQGALDAAIVQEQLNKLFYQRDLQLKKLGAISLAALDQAKEAVDASAAVTQEAQGAYDLTIINAPFAGRLGISKINLGDYLQSGTEIVSLQNLDPMFLDFNVPEKYFSYIKVGETVKINANTLPNNEFTGKIISYETVIDQNTGMLQARATLANPQGDLLPGGYATAIIYTGVKKKVISIPQTALIYDAEGPYVYLAQKDKAIRQAVTVGDQIQQNIEIKQGLRVGDIIISAGTNKVQNNATIDTVMEAGAV